MVKKSVLILCAGILVSLGMASYFLIRSYNKIVVKPNKPVNNGSSVVSENKPSPTPTLDPLRPYSVLLMGYGGGNHDGGLLTDSIIVAKVQPKEKKVTLISIPRDLWVPIPTAGDEVKNYKINAAYAIGSDDRKYPNKKIEFTGEAGGGELSKYVIGQVVGFNIDNFIALDFAGFVKTVDILGGVDVPVAKTFDDYFYPIEEKVDDTCGKSPEEIQALTATMSGLKLEQSFICRYEHLHFSAGINHMDGTTALKYVRSRHSPQDGGDFNRSSRQRILISSVKDRVMSLNFIPKIIPFVKTLSNNLQTDIGLSAMQEYLGKAEELSQYKIESVALTDENVLKQGRSSDGQFILMPVEGENNWDNIHKFIEDTILQSPDASSSATKSSSTQF